MTTLRYTIVDQDGLLLGDESGPFTFPSLADARRAAGMATARIGGRLQYRAARYETHGRMRDTIELDDETGCGRGADDQQNAGHGDGSNQQSHLLPRGGSTTAPLKAVKTDNGRGAILPRGESGLGDRPNLSLVKGAGA